MTAKTKSKGSSRVHKLSGGTLSNYVNKAASELGDLHAQAGLHDDWSYNDADDEQIAAATKYNNRLDGIKRAVKRMSGMKSGGRAKKSVKSEGAAPTGRLDRPKRGRQ